MEFKESSIPKFVWDFVKKYSKSIITAGILALIIWNFLKRKGVKENYMGYNLESVLTEALNIDSLEHFKFSEEDGIKDKTKWKKALVLFKQKQNKNPSSSSDYALVTSIYQKMGGEFNYDEIKKENLSLVKGDKYSYKVKGDNRTREDWIFEKEIGEIYKFNKKGWPSDMVNKKHLIWIEKNGQRLLLEKSENMTIQNKLEQLHKEATKTKLDKLHESVCKEAKFKIGDTLSYLGSQYVVEDIDDGTYHLEKPYGPNKKIFAPIFKVDNSAKKESLSKESVCKEALTVSSTGGNTFTVDKEDNMLIVVEVPRNKASIDKIKNIFQKNNITKFTIYIENSSLFIAIKKAELNKITGILNDNNIRISKKGSKIKLESLSPLDKLHESVCKEAVAVRKSTGIIGITFEAEKIIGKSHTQGSKGGEIKFKYSGEHAENKSVTDSNGNSISINCSNGAGVFKYKFKESPDNYKTKNDSYQLIDMVWYKNNKPLVQLHSATDDRHITVELLINNSIRESLSSLDKLHESICKEDLLDRRNKIAQKFFKKNWDKLTSSELDKIKKWDEEEYQYLLKHGRIKKESLSPLDKLHESVLKEGNFKKGDFVKYKGRVGKIDNISGDKTIADITWNDGKDKDMSIPVNKLTLFESLSPLDKLHESVCKEAFTKSPGKVIIASISNSPAKVIYNPKFGYILRKSNRNADWDVKNSEKQAIDALKRIAAKEGTQIKLSQYYGKNYNPNGDIKYGEGRQEIKSLSPLDKLHESVMGEGKIKNTFTAVLNDPQGRALIDQIEELTNATEPRLKAIRKRLIAQLKKDFGVAWIESS